MIPKLYLIPRHRDFHGAIEAGSEKTFKTITQIFRYPYKHNARVCIRLEENSKSSATVTKKAEFCAFQSLTLSSSGCNVERNAE